uniref:Polyprotein n=1 Tax=Caliciviridae sp. TaxID=1916234 RepID=A0A6M9Z764_9CALI|nr:MAG: polyprotein [Caliciviridae sp.]
MGHFFGRSLLLTTTSVVMGWLSRYIKTIGGTILKRIAAHLGVVFASFNVTMALRPSEGPRRPFAGRALDDAEYDQHLYDEARRAMRREFTVEDFMAARRGDRGADPTLTAYWNLRQARRAAGAWQPISEGPGPVAEMKTPGGTRVGHLVHLGAGLYVGLRHCFKQLKPEGYEEIHADGDLGFYKGPGDRPYLTVADMEPAQLAGIPVRSTERGSFIASQATVVGYKVRPEQTIRTGPGYCGTPYLDKDGRMVGIHAASGPGYLLCHEITRAQVAMAKRKMARPMSWRGIPAYPSPVPQGPLPNTSNYQATTREGCASEPALAGTGDERGGPSQITLLQDALANFMKEPGPIQPWALAAAQDYVTRQLKSWVGDADLTQLGFYDALHTLNLDTSCGPFVRGKKKDHFDEDGSLRQGELYDHLHSCWDTLQSGKPIQHAYKLGLKDEMLPKHKVMSKKRLLWAADVGLTHAMAAVFYPLFERIKAGAPHHGIGVGMNADSLATLEAFQARAEGKHVVVGDYRQWDSTLHPSILAAAINAMFALVPSTQFSRALQRTLLTCPTGYVLDVCVNPLRGLPSGIPGTSFLNSVAHLVLHAYCVTLSAVESGLGRVTMGEFDIITYGDDFVCFWPPSARGMETLYAEQVAKLGMVITSPTKGPFGERSDITFLKRTYATWGADGYDWVEMPYLDAESIVRQFHYMKGRSKPNPMEYRPMDTPERRSQLVAALAYASVNPDVDYGQLEYLYTIQCADFPPTRTESAASHASHVAQATAPVDPVQPSGHELDIVFKHTSEIPTSESGICSLSAMEPTPSLGTPGSSNQTPASADPTIHSADAGGSVNATPVAAPQTGASALATTSTGVATGIDPYIFGNFVLAHRLTWRPTHAPGTVLLTASLGPALNPYLDHLAAMYAGWSGSMRLQLLVSGAGSFGGMVTAAVVPPGGQAASPATMGTGYPHLTVDVRQLSGLVITLPDITTLNYHRIPQERSELTTSLIITVLTPLINPFATSGSTPYAQAAEILVLTAPGEDFQFHLLSPPRTMVQPHSYGRATDPSRWHDNRYGARVRRLVFLSNWHQQNHHFDSNGDTMGWSGPDPRLPIRAILEGNVPTNTVESRIYFVRAGGTYRDIIRGIPQGWPDIRSTGVWTEQQSQGSPNPFSGRAFGVLCTGTVGSSSPSDRSRELSAIGIPAMAYPFVGTQAHNTMLSGGPLQSEPTIVEGTHHVGFVFTTGYNTTGTNLGNSLILSPSAVVNRTGSAPNGTFDDTPVTIYGRTNPFFPPAGYSVVAFASQPTNSSQYDTRAWLRASQPAELSIHLASNPNPFPPSEMAIFMVHSPSSGESFQMALLSNGYMVTGPMQANSYYEIPDDLSVEFIGMGSVGAAIRGPAGVAPVGTRGATSQE